MVVSVRQRDDRSMYQAAALLPTKLGSFIILRREKRVGDARGFQMSHRQTTYSRSHLIHFVIRKERHTQIGSNAKFD